MWVTIHRKKTQARLLERSLIFASTNDLALLLLALSDKNRYPL